MTGKNVMKRASTLLLALVVCAAMMGFTAMPAKAVDDPWTVNQDGFEFMIYFDGGTTPTSIWITKYTGTEKNVTLPSHILYEGKNYQVEAIADEAFKGNTTMEKLIVPKGYAFFGKEAFSGCTALKEAIIGAEGSDGSYFSSGGDGANNMFANCPNLKTYRLGWTDEGSISTELGIGKDASGNIMAGVTAYVPSGSGIYNYLVGNNSDSANKITINPIADPASAANITKVITIGGGSTSVDKTKQKGTDGTYYGAGASKEAVDKALTALKGEKDQKGMAFGKLRLKMKKVAKTSITLGWSKPSGTKQIVIYGNKCGTATKYIKLATVTGTSYKVAKVSGKKVKKGTFYKFVIVALDKNGNVVSTSKTIHVATTGGKVTNHKALTVKAKVSGKYKKVSKISVKKGKKKTLKVTGVKASKKLATKKHVPVRYESANTKIAKVSSKGVITGVKKGKCKVYAFAQSGACKAITVIVK